MDLSIDSKSPTAARFTAFVAVELGAVDTPGAPCARGRSARPNLEPFATRAEAWAHAWASVKTRFQAQGQSIQGLRPSYFFAVAPAVFEATADGARWVATQSAAPAHHASRQPHEIDRRVARSVRDGIERGERVRDLLARIESQIDTAALEAQTTYAYTRLYGATPIVHFSSRAFALIEWLRDLADPWSGDRSDWILRLDDDSECLGIAGAVSIAIVEQGGVAHYRFGAEDACFEGSVRDVLDDELPVDPALIRDLDEEEALDDAEVDGGA